MTTHYEREEVVGTGLKYTEETGRTEGSIPVRDCSLWQAGVDEPISAMNVLSFRQCFGAVSIPTEGIGGVETLPSFRQRGYVSKLLVKAIEEIAKRVPIVFVSDAIEDLYEKFGFVNCLAEAYLRSTSVSSMHGFPAAGHNYCRSHMPTDWIDINCSLVIGGVADWS